MALVLLSRRSLWLLAFAVAMTTCAFLHAGIAWSKARLEFTPEVGVSEVVADYAFQVTGEGPLLIDSVDTGCGCADYEIERKEYRPGESGVVKVRVRIGDREGLYQTPMLVHWRQGDKKGAETLFIQIAIPAIAQFSQRVLLFAPNDTTKSLQVDVPGHKAINLKLGEIVGDYKASLKESPGGRYVLSVTAGDHLQSGFVEVAAERENALVKKWRIFLRVRQ